MSRAVLLGHGPWPPRRLWAPWLRGARWIIAADGGANRAVRERLRVDLVVGDLDGIRPSVLRRFPKRRVVYDPDPDHTDLEKALKVALRRGAKELTLIGFLGGRLDHTLGTLAVLAQAPMSARIVALDARFRVERVRRRLGFEAKKGTMVSLIAPGGATGVTSVGLRFPQEGSKLPFSPLGVHNEALGGAVEIVVRSGCLFVLVADLDAR